jgi:hypothetical protein
MDTVNPSLEYREANTNIQDKLIIAIICNWKIMKMSVIS